MPDVPDNRITQEEIDFLTAEVRRNLAAAVTRVEREQETILLRGVPIPADQITDEQMALLSQAVYHPRVVLPPRPVARMQFWGRTDVLQFDPPHMGDDLIFNVGRVGPHVEHDDRLDASAYAFSNALS